MSVPAASASIADLFAQITDASPGRSSSSRLEAGRAVGDALHEAARGVGVGDARVRSLAADVARRAVAAARDAHAGARAGAATALGLAARVLVRQRRAAGGSGGGSGSGGGGRVDALSALLTASAAAAGAGTGGLLRLDSFSSARVLAAGAPLLAAGPAAGDGVSPAAAGDDALSPADRLLMQRAAVARLIGLEGARGGGALAPARGARRATSGVPRADGGEAAALAVTDFSGLVDASDFAARPGGGGGASLLTAGAAAGELLPAPAAGARERDAAARGSGGGGAPADDDDGLPSCAASLADAYCALAHAAFDPAWHVRHGAALAIERLLEGLGVARNGEGVDDGEGAAAGSVVCDDPGASFTREFGPPVVQDAALRCVAVLALDRVGDFTGRTGRGGGRSAAPRGGRGGGGGGGGRGCGDADVPAPADNSADADVNADADADADADEEEEDEEEEDGRDEGEGGEEDEAEDPSDALGARGGALAVTGSSRAPVREAAARVLRLAARALPPAGAAALVRALEPLAGARHSEHARHGAALGLFALLPALRGPSRAAAVARAAPLALALLGDATREGGGGSEDASAVAAVAIRGLIEDARGGAPPAAAVLAAARALLPLAADGASPLAGAVLPLAAAALRAMPQSAPAQAAAAAAAAAPRAPPLPALALALGGFVRHPCAPVRRAALDALSNLLDAPAGAGGGGEGAAVALVAAAAAFRAALSCAPPSARRSGRRAGGAAGEAAGDGGDAGAGGSGGFDNVSLEDALVGAAAPLEAWAASILAPPPPGGGATLASRAARGEEEAASALCSRALALCGARGSARRLWPWLRAAAAALCTPDGDVVCGVAVEAGGAALALWGDDDGSDGDDDAGGLGDDAGGLGADARAAAAADVQPEASPAGAMSFHKRALGARLLAEGLCLPGVVAAAGAGDDADAGAGAGGGTAPEHPVAAFARALVAAGVDDGAPASVQAGGLLLAAAAASWRAGAAPGAPPPPALDEPTLAAALARFPPELPEAPPGAGAPGADVTGTRAALRALYAACADLAAASAAAGRPLPPPPDAAGADGGGGGGGGALAPASREPSAPPAKRRRTRVDAAARGGAADGVASGAASGELLPLAAVPAWAAALQRASDPAGAAAAGVVGAAELEMQTARVAGLLAAARAAWAAGARLTAGALALGALVRPPGAPLPPRLTPALRALLALVCPADAGAPTLEAGQALGAAGLAFFLTRAWGESGASGGGGGGGGRENEAAAGGAAADLPAVAERVLERVLAPLAAPHYAPAAALGAALALRALVAGRGGATAAALAPALAPALSRARARDAGPVGALVAAATLRCCGVGDGDGGGGGSAGVETAAAVLLALSCGSAPALAGLLTHGLPAAAAALVPALERLRYAPPGAAVALAPARPPVDADAARRAALEAVAALGDDPRAPVLVGPSLGGRGGAPQAVPAAVALAAYGAVFVPFVLSGLGSATPGVRAAATAALRAIVSALPLRAPRGRRPPPPLPALPAGLRAAADEGARVVATLRGGARAGLERLPLSVADAVGGRRGRWRGPPADAAGGGPPPPPPPPAFPIPLPPELRGYQLEGVRWLCFLSEHRLGGVLADDMGLGKSVQTLAAIALYAHGAAAGAVGGAAGAAAPAGAPAASPSVVPPAQPSPPAHAVSLVACPSSLLHHWSAEVARFFGAPGGGGRVVLRAVVLEGAAGARDAALTAALGAPPAPSPAPSPSPSPSPSPGTSAAPPLTHTLLIVSHALVRRDARVLAARLAGRLAFFVLDEAHVASTAGGALAEGARALGAAAAARVALTGTPIQNSVLELWAAFDWLLPGYLGDAGAFRRGPGAAVARARAPGATAADVRAARAALRGLHGAVLPFVLRRLKGDVLPELPARTVVDVPVDLAPRQRRLYDAFMARGAVAAWAHAAVAALEGGGGGDGALVEGEDEGGAAAAGGAGPEGESGRGGGRGGAGGGGAAAAPAAAGGPPPPPRAAAAGGGGAPGGAFTAIRTMRAIIGHPALVTDEELLAAAGGAPAAGARARARAAADAARERFPVGDSCKLLGLLHLLRKLGIAAGGGEEEEEEAGAPSGAPGGGGGGGGGGPATAGGAPAPRRAPAPAPAAPAAPAGAAAHHKLLVFAQSPRLLDAVEAGLFRALPALAGVRFARLDGATPPPARARAAAAFNADPSLRVLLLTTGVGGLGLSLVGADSVVFLELAWNPSVDAQAMDRAHRLGQARPVTVFRLIARGTLEERVAAVQRFKTATAAVVVGGGGGGGAGPAGTPAGGAGEGRHDGRDALDVLAAGRGV